MAVGENESLQYDITDDSVPPYNPKHRFSLAFKRASYQAPEEIWNLFSEAEDCCDIIDYFNALIKSMNIDRNIHGVELYDILKSKLTSWKCQSLWDLLNARLKHSEYKQGNAAKGKTCMIIGCGPIGLRTAIECLMLGCKTIIVEKRDEFARNNVLHLWPFLMTDFRNLGAKKFFGKFGAGCIEHINIKTLQSILLKVALILGAEVYVGVCFNNLVEPVDENTGWRGSFLPENHVLSKAEFDIIIGADGKKNILPGFEQIELRGALAIGITCNFVNNNTIEEARVNEISGISFQYNQNFFLKMEEKYGVRLENIVYYKDETHYFVMTALKNSLLKLEVLKEDFSDPSKLITSSNIDKQKLMEFARSAVDFATDHQLPEDLEYNKLSNGEPDIALFDFTSLKKASNASRIIERNKKKLLLTLVGDSLIEPFWPTGSGAGRGVLSALDCAWLIKQYCSNHPPLACVRERENIYKLLSGITNDSLQKNHKAFTIDPKTRYTAFDSRKVSNIASLQSLYDTDDLENADLSVTSPQQKEKDTSFVKKRRRSSSGGGKKKTITSTHVHPHGQTVVTGKKRTSPLKDTKQEPTVGNTKQFWEEHNKKNLTDRAKQHVSKAKKRTTPSIEEEGIDMEGWSEIDDDVIEDSKLSARSTKSIKSARDKSPRENKENSLKRQKTKDNLLKRQKSKEALSPTKSKPSKAKTPDSKKGTLKKENTKRKISMKQDPARPVDPKSFFRIWLNKIQEKFKEKANINQDDPEAVNNGPSALVMATQSAALGGMALPMLLDCNRPPKRRTTDIKLRDLQLAKQALLNPSTDAHKETQDISVKRAGSVRNTIEKLKEITKDGNPSNYYDFVNKKPNSNDKVDGKSTDFTPKVIDVEAMVRKEEKEEQKKSKAVKATWNLTSSDSEAQLRASLEEFCEPQTPLASILMLQVLYNIHKRIYDEPHVEKYYRIFIKGTVFERYVWQLEGASKFLQFLGWIKCGNYIVLSKSYPVATSLKVIESVLRRKKKAEGGISRQTSLKNRHPNVDIIGEDEVVASFTKVENDIDSGVEDVEEHSTSSTSNVMRRFVRRIRQTTDKRYQFNNNYNK
ncbi:uncharacterized protein [Clytia hemisphaerica]|uniref:uncharacterized protein isoform X2 n=1 Tax=Clytia hemisphaerica TaxID=252671 RepID=UPI0034D68D55